MYAQYHSLKINNLDQQILWRTCSFIPLLWRGARQGGVVLLYSKSCNISLWRYSLLTEDGDRTDRTDKSDRTYLFQKSSCPHYCFRLETPYVASQNKNASREGAKTRRFLRETEYREEYITQRRRDAEKRQ